MPKRISRYSVGLAPTLHPDGPYVVVVSATQKPYPGDNDTHYADYWACQARSTWLNLSTKEREKSAGSSPSPRPTTAQPVPEASPVPSCATAHVVRCPYCSAEPGRACTSLTSAKALTGGAVHEGRTVAWGIIRQRDAAASAPTADAPAVDEGGGETDHPPIVIQAIAPEPGEARSVACPTCKAQPGHPCVRPSGQEIQGYDVHSPRAKAWVAQQAKAARAQTPEEGAA